MAVSSEFVGPSAVRLQAEFLPVGLKRDLRSIGGLKLSTVPGAYPIEFKLDASLSRVQSYRLTMSREGITVSTANEPGMTYGMQTLLQILTLFKGVGLSEC
ncbi:hypothetical protein DRQ11_15210 [candidate division KSB1 bacterium]|nr:MAG: hypothetical protein DRQ11_15210 [candidate division KSB1 bacterium]